MITLTPETDVLDGMIKGVSKVIVMFGTPGCGYCEKLKPEFERVSEEHSDILFVFCDPDILPNSSKVVQITNIPMLVSFLDGEEIGSVIGSHKENVGKALDFFNQ